MTRKKERMKDIELELGLELELELEKERKREREREREIEIQRTQPSVSRVLLTYHEFYIGRIEREG